MDTRKNRAKRIKLKQNDYVDFDQASAISSSNDPEDSEEARKSRIRDSNNKFAQRMTILQTWSEHWSDYSTREGLAYPQQEAKSILKKTKKITCPIESCNKSFTSWGGLKYHYARCNIERSFKCKVCDPPIQVTTRGELLRHMILNHYQDLPALDAQQKEIVNSYLSLQNRCGNKRDKKIGADTEAPCTGERLIRAFKELREKVYKSETYSDRPFRDWPLFANDWGLLKNDAEKRRYYPPESESINVKCNSDEEWVTMKTGESRVLSKDRQNSATSTLLYTGGINTSSAWLPKSYYDNQANSTPELIAISVDCCSMDQSHTYKESHDDQGCIQFWNVVNGPKDQGDQTLESSCDCSLGYMVGHNYGTIFEMVWCPLGTSWQPPVNAGDTLARVGLLALACGDGQVRILSVPHSNSLLSMTTEQISDNTIGTAPIFKVKPIASLMAPGVGPSSDYQTISCKSLCWGIENNQRLIAAGYSNGTVAIFDLANNSPILYNNFENRHIYQPLKSWVAHGGPVTGIAISAGEDALIATGSIDRQMKVWNPMDLSCCLTNDRSPITKILWDFRFRGVVTATDSAFTSFHNRVSYKYPVAQGSGSHNMTVSTHRSTVWGLSNSIVSNAIASADGAGEVFVVPLLMNKSLHKREKGLLSVHSVYTMIPRALEDKERNSVIKFATATPDLNGTAQKPNNETNGDVDENNLEINLEHNLENNLEADADFSIVERPIANVPTNFLLPIEHRPVENYAQFKSKFGFEFINYNFTAMNQESKLPESCTRAGDMKDIFCDRPCDYPFSSINTVSWSPNPSTFSHLLSCAQVGLCRLDKIPIVEQVYRGYVNSMLTNSK